MRRCKRFMNVFASYAVILSVLLMLLVFPKDIYGKNYEKRTVGIKTFNGKYLCAESGGESALTADRDKIAEWETFQLVDLGKGYVALIGCNGKYVSVSQGGKALYANSSKVKSESTFQLVKLDNNKVAFRAHNKKYLCAEDGGGGKVVADRKKIGDWEAFELVQLEENSYEPCRLTAVSGDNSILLTWTEAKNTKEIIGYNLYRSTSAGKQTSSPITDFPIQETSYTDKNVERGVTYFYIAKAVYKDKNLGPASNEVAVRIESRVMLKAEQVEDGVRLYWNEPSGSKEVIGYNLYRATESGRQSDTPVTDFPIKGASYTDKNVENNREYFYILKPVYKDKTLGPVSNETVIKTNFYHKAIVLEVGNRYMLVDGKVKEVDPGKGTIVVMKNGRVFLPIKTVVEVLGGEVLWDSAARRVSITLKGKQIHLWIGEKVAKVNGVNKESDVAPYISESGRTMLPLRFIVENLECKADWDGQTQKITIEAK